MKSSASRLWKCVPLLLGCLAFAQAQAPNISYKNTPVIYARGIAIIPDSIVNTGGAVIQFSVLIDASHSALPYGLTLNVSTGIISGTPTATSQAQYYFIIATGPGGLDTAVITIRVVSLISCSMYDSPITFVVGIASTPQTPCVSGYVTHYSVSPPLPAGLILDSVSGVLSGTPTVQSFAKDYVITTTSFAGSTPYTVNIAVVAAPNNLSYTDNAPIYAVGQAIAPPNKPNVQGITTLYSIAPALPAGITFDQTTGIIQGTPMAVSPATDYTITAQNPGGSATTTIRLTVINRATTGIQPRKNR